MWVKICGVCSVESARVVAEAGADALGLNFVSRSKRKVSEDDARAIAAAVRGRIELIGVVEDCSIERADALREALKLDRIQMHTARVALNESELPEWAYLAAGISSSADAAKFAVPLQKWVLVDACVAGKSGGTGSTFNWNWVKQLAKKRSLILAGGLSVSNVAQAIATALPFGVDVASGVEPAGNPGKKDPELVREFVRLARSVQR